MSVQRGVHDQTVKHNYSRSKDLSLYKGNQFSFYKIKQSINEEVA